MQLFREIWNLLLGFVTLGAGRGNPVALSVLLIAGALVLFAGRRLFWLVAGMAGYFVGSAVGPLVVGPIPFLGGALSLGLAVIVGLIAAAAQHLTARLVTALAVAPLVFFLVNALGLPGWIEVLIVIAGVLGALVLLQYAFDAVLITIAVIYGAVAVLGATARFLPNGRWVQNPVFFLLLLVAGAVVQGLVLWQQRAEPILIPPPAGGIAPATQQAVRFRREWLDEAAQRVPAEVMGLGAHEAAAVPSQADTPVGAALGPEFHDETADRPSPTPGTARD